MLDLLVEKKNHGWKSREDPGLLLLSFFKFIKNGTVVVVIFLKLVFKRSVSTYSIE